MKISRQELKSIIRKELAEVLSEFSSEKQRRWACAQKDKPASERPEGLSAEEAEEMCKSKVEEGLPFDSSKVRRKMMTDRPVGNPDFPSGHPFSQE